MGCTATVRTARPCSGSDAVGEDSVPAPNASGGTTTSIVLTNKSNHLQERRLSRRRPRCRTRTIGAKGLRTP